MNADIMKAKIYEYSGCSTCRAALKFLDTRKIPYEKMAIVDTPPSRAELKRMLDFLQGDLRKLFNTSGLVYRELKLGKRLPSLSEADALSLLAKHGKLIKRPFLLTKRGGAVGFKEAEWKKLLSGE